MAHPYTFPIDPFQQQAFDCLARDENVLVTAKTGSGKTLIGEYQIWRSIQRGKRVFYTTPIKSLTNQKFHDLKKIHSSVGIMTGDIKFAPQSDIVVMTTEILRNLLYKQGSVTETIGITADLSLKDVDAIVFDEVHYINDTERGRVWEECFILLPPSIRLVLLSATLYQPEPFVDWLTQLKGVPMNLISTTYRVVPLYHKVGDALLMGADNRFHKDVYTQYLRDLQTQHDALRRHKDDVKKREANQEVVKREVRDHSFVYRMNEHIAMLERENLLPALFFVFSRKQCEVYASKVQAQLVDSSDSAAIRHILNFHLHRYPELQTLPQYHDLSQLLLKGIAYHHSGLLPVLKEIVEILFGRGFVKLLFATETFAVGINMPTKTVVFTSYRKYDDAREGMRILRTDEYIQMAGRAGRRGKDDKGIVYYLPDREPEPVLDVEVMMTGKQSSVCSRMDFGYAFLLKALLSGHLNWKTILESSYWNVQEQTEISRLKAEVETLRANLPVVELDCLERASLETAFKTQVNAAKKDAQRKLEAWKNKHPGPKWDVSWTQWKLRKTQEDQIARMEADIGSYSQTRPIEERLKELEQMGYLTPEGTLTQLGVMAAEINEGDPLDMARKYQEKAYHSFGADFLIAHLAEYVEHKKDEDFPSAIWDWMNRGDFAELCQTYEMDAGTFQKAILKTANILEEWTTLAHICEDLEMLEKLRGAKEKLVRGIVIPDSLYLRI